MSNDGGNGNLGLGDFDFVSNQSEPNNQESNEMPVNNGVNADNNANNTQMMPNNNQNMNNFNQQNFYNQNSINSMSNNMYSNSSQAQGSDNSFNNEINVGSNINSAQTIFQSNQSSENYNQSNFINQQPINSMANMQVANNNTQDLNGNNMTGSQFANNGLGQNPMPSIENNTNSLNNAGNINSQSSANQMLNNNKQAMQEFLKNYWKYILIGLGVIILVILAVTLAKNLISPADSSLGKNETLLATCSSDMDTEGNLKMQTVQKFILNKEHIDDYGIKVLSENHLYTNSDISDEQFQSFKDAYLGKLYDFTVACPEGNFGNYGCNTQANRIGKREIVISGYTYKPNYNKSNYKDMVKELKDAGYTCK